MVFLALSVLGHEVDLAINLIPVSIVDPEHDVRYDAERHPGQLEVLLDDLQLLILILNDRQANVQERYRTEDADE